MHVASEQRADMIHRIDHLNSNAMLSDLGYCLIHKSLNKANEVFKFTQLKFFLTACSINFPEEDMKAYYFHNFPDH